MKHNFGMVVRATRAGADAPGEFVYINSDRWVQKIGGGIVNTKDIVIDTVLTKGYYEEIPEPKRYCALIKDGNDRYWWRTNGIWIDSSAYDSAEWKDIPGPKETLFGGVE